MQIEKGRQKTFMKKLVNNNLKKSAGNVLALL